MIVPVFLPHLGCGQRCTYCNQNFITDNAGTYRLEERIASLLGSVKTPVEVALYGGNPLGLEPGSLERLLALFKPYEEKIARLRISAKPGPVSRSAILVLKQHRVGTIELGTPTFNDRILGLLSRGHTSKDSRDALLSLKEEGFETGMQVMVGLPEETDDDLRGTVSAIFSLSPSFIRIYPLVVIEETPLFEQFS
jgi:histone acetyltransferase (RNA polymerase elongator complex component)